MYCIIIYALVHSIFHSGIIGVYKTRNCTTTILSYKNNKGINGTGMACSIGVSSLSFIHHCLWKLGMGFLVTHTWFRSGGLQRLDIVSNFSVTLLYCPVKRSLAKHISHIWTGEGQRSCSSTDSIDHYHA